MIEKNITEFHLESTAVVMADASILKKNVTNSQPK